MRTEIHAQQALKRPFTVDGAQLGSFIMHHASYTSTSIITYSFHKGKLRRLLFNQCRFEFFTRSVRIFDGGAAHQILELDGGLGGTSCLLHDGKGNDLVGFLVNLNRHAILNVGGIDGHGERCRSSKSWS
jgi:hypothetical protein